MCLFVVVCTFLVLLYIFFTWFSLCCALAGTHTLATRSSSLPTAPICFRAVRRYVARKRILSFYFAYNLLLFAYLLFMLFVFFPLFFLPFCIFLHLLSSGGQWNFFIHHYYHLVIIFCLLLIVYFSCFFFFSFSFFCFCNISLLFLCFCNVCVSRCLWFGS